MLKIQNQSRKRNAFPSSFDASMKLMLYCSCLMSSGDARSSHFSVALSAFLSRFLASGDNSA